MKMKSLNLILAVLLILLNACQSGCFNRGLFYQGL